MPGVLALKPYTRDEAEADLIAAFAAGDEHRADVLAPAVDALDARARRAATVHSAALWYVGMGLHVFPLQPGLKVPLKGSNGLNGATTDPEMIDLWWRGNRDLNVGIATGHLVDVIDIDGPPGVASYLQLMDDLPRVYGKVTTPRAGGFHLYVPAEPGRGNRAKILPGIDYRGTGGYVVAPPSRISAGDSTHGPYRWLQPLDLEALKADQS